MKTNIILLIMITIGLMSTTGCDDRRKRNRTKPKDITHNPKPAPAVPKVIYKNFVGEVDKSFGVDGVSELPARVQKIVGDSFGLAVDKSGNLYNSIDYIDSEDQMRKFGVVKLLPSGKVDLSFGDKGIAVIESEKYSQYYNAISTLKDGNILAFGQEKGLHLISSSGNDLSIREDGTRRFSVEDPNFQANKVVSFSVDSSSGQDRIFTIVSGRTIHLEVEANLALYEFNKDGDLIPPRATDKGLYLRLNITRGFDVKGGKAILAGYDDTDPTGDRKEAAVVIDLDSGQMTTHHIESRFVGGGEFIDVKISPNGNVLMTGYGYDDTSYFGTLIIFDSNMNPTRADGEDEEVWFAGVHVRPNGEILTVGIDDGDGYCPIIQKLSDGKLGPKIKIEVPDSSSYVYGTAMVDVPGDGEHIYVQLAHGHVVKMK